MRQHRTDVSESMWMSVQAYASDVATVPKGHVMNSTGESRESWCSKKDAWKPKAANQGKGDTWETQMGQQRQRRDMRNNLSDIIGLGGFYKNKPKRQTRFMRFVQEKI